MVYYPYIRGKQFEFIFLGGCVLLLTTRVLSYQSLTYLCD